MRETARRRKETFVWVTGMSKILAGETSCHWSTWFRSHYTYEKRHSDFDMQNWVLDHTRLINHTVRQLELAEYSVTIEGQNRFSLRGSSGVVLGGAPDIIAYRGDEVLIVDCKTGKPRVSHEYQVLIYMLSIPLAIPKAKDKYVTGLVQYENDALTILNERIDNKVKADFREQMARVGGETPPRRVASLSECRFCDIASDYCDERLEWVDEQPIQADELF